MVSLDGPLPDFPYPARARFNLVPSPDLPPADARVLTLLLDRINAGDESASSELLPLVYDELHALASKLFPAQGAAQTLQATALVHEAYLKLLRSQGERKDWDGRRHFFAVAATAMRRVLTDYVRKGQTSKRGGGAHRVTLSDAEVPGTDGIEFELFDLHEALEELEAVSPRIARVVELRFFSGMTVEEVAEELGVTERSVFKDWRAGRAILGRRLSSDEPS